MTTTRKTLSLLVNLRTATQGLGHIIDVLDIAMIDQGNHNIEIDGPGVRKQLRRVFDDIIAARALL